MWQLGRLSGPNVTPYLYLWEVTFSTEIKSMEISRNMKFAYNVATLIMLSLIENAKIGEIQYCAMGMTVATIVDQ